MARESADWLQSSLTAAPAARCGMFRALGAVRVNVSLPAEPADKILPMLDRWAKLKRQLGN